jgi:Ricin-type beta-trefoil lectin domain
MQLTALPRRSRRRAAAALGATALAVALGATWGPTALAAPTTHAATNHTAVTPAAVTTGQITGYQGMCLDVRAAATADGTPVQVYTCNGTNAQQWSVDTSAGTVQALGKCLDVSGAGTANGTKVQLWTCNGTGAQVWQHQSNGEYLNPNSGKCLDDTGFGGSGTQVQIWACADSSNQQWTLPTGGVTPPPNTPNFGPNVLVFTPSMSSSAIQSQINSVYNTQQSNQFGTQRYALLFAPGTYNVDVPIGFYTQVLGLGQSPTQTTITGGGVHADANWNGGNATINFWRDAENLTTSPSSGNTVWATSQATPLRRMDINGSLALSLNGFSSGGFISDSVVTGQVNSGSQQQYISRNDQFGSWTGSNWNMVFVGSTGVPGTSFPNPPDTNVSTTPTVEEKPYLYVDGSGNYNVFVPGVRNNSQGTSWTGGATAGSSLPISSFYLAHSGDSAATINAQLAAGQNLIFTPGIYNLNGSINVTRADTVVLGLGLATLVPSGGSSAITVADVNGVHVAGLMIDAGTTNSPVLMQVGPSGSSASHASDPTMLSDVFFRIGGATVGRATQTLQVNSANVIGDDLWLWRADHGNGGTTGWSTNTAANGLVVNGANVTMYGLAVEHYQQTQVQWNGNGGKNYFFQSEMPYDPPNQASWMNGSSDGYPAFAVANSVTSFQAFGMGTYCFFSTNPGTIASNAYTSPNVSGVSWHDLVAVSIAGTGTIQNVINGTGQTANSANNVAKVTTYP